MPPPLCFAEHPGEPPAPASPWGVLGPLGSCLCSSPSPSGDWCSLGAPPTWSCVLPETQEIREVQGLKLWVSLVVRLTSALVIGWLLYLGQLDPPWSPVPTSGLLYQGLRKHHGSLSFTSHFLLVLPKHQSTGWLFARRKGLPFPALSSQYAPPPTPTCLDTHCHLLICHSSLTHSRGFINMGEWMDDGLSECNRGLGKALDRTILMYSWAY